MAGKFAVIYSITAVQESGTEIKKFFPSRCSLPLPLFSQKALKYMK